ncbi:hypothetical protein P4131_03715 [Pseudomonas aeruginosa]|nr:hypothetical protein [Pseudomonas aeruginosa]
MARIEALKRHKVLEARLADDLSASSCSCNCA